MQKCQPTGSWMRDGQYFPTPITTTHESLEVGRTLTTKVRYVSRKLLNFQSYPMDKYRSDRKQVEPKKQMDFDYVTTYIRDYALPYPIVCAPRNPHEGGIPDFLFNRKPMNDFILLKSHPNKFMDDHIADISPGRKKINFFRQLRDEAYEFI